MHEVLYGPTLNETSGPLNLFSDPDTREVHKDLHLKDTKRDRVLTRRSPGDPRQTGTSPDYEW